MICFLEFGVAGGGGRDCCIKIQKGSYKNVKENLESVELSQKTFYFRHRRAYPGSRIMESFFAS